jgi:hypothetical protein
MTRRSLALAALDGPSMLSGLSGLPVLPVLLVALAGCHEVPSTSASSSLTEGPTAETSVERLVPAAPTGPGVDLARTVPSEEVVLDRRADGARLMGRLEPVPENADPDRVLRLQASGASLAPALHDARVLDARFAPDDALVVLGADHVLRLHLASGAEIPLDGQVEPPLSLVGQRVAYVRGSPPELEVAVVDLPSGAVYTVTEGMAPAWSPALSPDGTQVLFVSAREGSPRLYVAPTAGGPPRALPPTERFPTAPIAPRWEEGALRFWDEQGELVLPLAEGTDAPPTSLGGAR